MLAIALNRFHRRDRTTFPRLMLMATDAVAIKVSDDLLDISGSHAQGCIGGPIIKPDGATVVFQYPAAREHHVRHVAAAFVFGFRPEHPLVAAYQYKARILAVEQDEPKTID